MKKKGKKHIIHYELNPSSQLLFEDHLKRCLNKTSGQNYKELRNKFAPRNKHSAFGDFPREFMPRKEETFELINIDSHQVANSVSGGQKTYEDKFGKSFKAGLPKQKGEPKAPISGAFSKRSIKVSDFRLHYDRGDLPILIEHLSGCKLKWKPKTDFEKFDYQLYLPIFVDGIREVTDPYRFLAIQGTFALLEKVKENVVKVIPQLILPLKAALNTRDPDIIAVALKVIQKLVLSSDLSGEALVPYYRQLLPIFNLYKNHNSNLGDGIEYGQRKKRALGDLIQETLEIMETHGGDDAFINIKYMIPTYESCVYDVRG